jgi:hypothetical protein
LATPTSLVRTETAIAMTNVVNGVVNERPGRAGFGSVPGGLVEGAADYEFADAHRLVIAHGLSTILAGDPISPSTATSTDATEPALRRLT